ncbi:hypothetical protein BCR33DRAFT_483849 [Rhizoclosmatium globosum]|uniref:Uncharacterized protein n=1 Tax=Rhizoclosmatium globosum TaxID=329046 RepID=A0A1Y2BN21_9FUNG|nr:hypothetical protein BCR33DRAFT_483849 [Rhizoclosmatium globosum]|eukprot:ORY36102.1 hypothetical protein BCR33DRAFT_483849 [Rhizoclosmatium globosum]
MQLGFWQTTWTGCLCHQTCSRLGLRGRCRWCIRLRLFVHGVFVCCSFCLRESFLPSEQVCRYSICTSMERSNQRKAFDIACTWW